MEILCLSLLLPIIIFGLTLPCPRLVVFPSLSAILPASSSPVLSFPLSVTFCLAPSLSLPHLSLRPACAKRCFIILCSVCVFGKPSENISVKTRRKHWNLSWQERHGYFTFWWSLFCLFYLSLKHKYTVCRVKLHFVKPLVHVK